MQSFLVIRDFFSQVLHNVLGGCIFKKIIYTSCGPVKFYKGTYFDVVPTDQFSEVNGRHFSRRIIKSRIFRKIKYSDCQDRWGHHHRLKVWRIRVHSPYSTINWNGK